jgi:tetratricopeptide (TPR) repeat protein
MTNIRIIVALVLAGFAMAAWSQNVVVDAETTTSLTSADVSDLFSQAKRLFAEGDEMQRDDPGAALKRYRQSLLYFETIVTDGNIRNGKVFYNIGNVYFRLGDLGNAILNYRRAIDYMPNDPNLIRNIAYARSKRVDDIQIDERSQITRILFFWHFDLASHFRFAVFMISFISVWIFAGLRVLMKKRGFTWAAIAFAALALLFLGSLGWETIAAGRNMPGVILADEVIGRKGNSETYQPSFQESLHAGTEFVLREDRGNWYLIELVDGRESWIPAISAEMVRLRSE